MTIRTSLTAAAAAVASLGLAACADLERRGDQTQYTTTTYTEYVPGDSKPREITRFADENRDGKVTREEAKADPNLAKAFDQYDKDKSGELSRAEFAQLEQAGGDAGSYRTVTRQVPLPQAQDVGQDYSLNRTGIDEIRPYSEE